MPWIAEPPLTTPRAALAATTCDAAAGTRIYAIGGATAAGITATVEAYDLQAHSWSAVAELPTGRGFSAATSTPACVHALGGVEVGAVTAAHSIYQPAQDAWSAAAPMPTPRGSLAAVTGPDGHI